MAGFFHNLSMARRRAKHKHHREWVQEARERTTWTIYARTIVGALALTAVGMPWAMGPWINYNMKAAIGSDPNGVQDSRKAARDHKKEMECNWRYKDAVNSGALVSAFA